MWDLFDICRGSGEHMSTLVYLWGAFVLSCQFYRGKCAGRIRIRIVYWWNAVTTITHQEGLVSYTRQIDTDASHKHWFSSTIISIVNMKGKHLRGFTDSWVSYGPRQANLVLIAYASSEGSGEPSHPHKQWAKRNLSDRKPDPRPHWMAGHAQLKFVMTECSKTQIRLTGLI